MERDFPGDITPPTDDRPFFFQMICFGDEFHASIYVGFNDYLARFWGINGATSVSASVLAVVISMGWGISSAFWAGWLAYAAAALAVVVLRARG